MAATPIYAAEPRPIEINVDATDAPRKLYRAKLVIPAKPGPLTLLYPKWIQGEHQPSGPIIDLSGLKLTAVRGIKILGTARPGEVLRCETRILRRMDGLVHAQVTASVNGTNVLQGELTLSGDPS